MPLVASEYKPPFYLKNPHLATVIPSTFRKIKGVQYQRERITTSDDDFLDLDWLKKGSDQLIIISHGLEGSATRPYVMGMAKYFFQNGWDALGWNCRSCSGEMNKKARFYHHGATEDLQEVIQYARETYGYRKIALVGFSMGGSLTLKYVGEMANHIFPEIKAAVAFSVPVDLASSVNKLAEKSNDFYRKRFLKKLEEKIKIKSANFPELIKYQDFEDIKYFPDFDNLYTAPLHGFKDAADFYHQASASEYMYKSKVPILIVNAKNDPFLGDGCFPYADCEKAEQVYLETPQYGGHVGFSLAGSEFNYMEKRTLKFVNEMS
ncbi:YheT family hydrolase [Fulvivirga sediminis]|uniref:Alpha/beta fold hydrolase n=1 Tax=Fulvivirga sediminis TaxID=2803949 RepID=A0A937F4Q6_9BACT|nr:alpha/beta fold hydrolase [Fulvivirga sediminis]MBL3655715.1 alpha/beta fold hydrolase [Fulvivirga sediminis]